MNTPSPYFKKPGYALTFDDGPGPSTSSLLDVLEKWNVKATFFNLGSNIEFPTWNSKRKVQDVLIRLVRDGHILGNHTVTHTKRPKGARSYINEIIHCDKLIMQIYDAAGVQTPKDIPFRLPYGPRFFETEVDLRLNWITSINRKSSHWTEIIPDWEKPSTDQVEKFFSMMKSHADEQIHHGFNTVFCMHDGAGEFQRKTTRQNTVGAVNLFLEYAADKKWPSFLVKS